MITGKFEDGNSVTETKTENYLTVEQVAAGAFVIKNSAGEIVVSNINKVEKASKTAFDMSRWYTLTGAPRPYGKPARAKAVRDCRHPATRLFSWLALNENTGKADILCVACCDCGAALQGAA